MTARTYDPFALERPKFRLGDQGEWDLADVTAANSKKLDELIAEFNTLVSNPDLEVALIADVVGRLLETSCEDADGLHAQIVALADVDKAKAEQRKPMGVIAMRGAVEFVLDWIYGEQTAGEG